MGVQLNICVAFGCFVRKIQMFKKGKQIQMFKKGQNYGKCDLDLKNLATLCLCCPKQYNLKV